MQPPPDDILGPSLSSFTHINGGIPDNLVPLKLSSAEMCIAETGECTKMRIAPTMSLAEPIGHLEVECTHEERYRPAYELADGSLERAGRASASNGAGKQLQS